MYRTPDGLYVGREYRGEKTKVFDSQKEFQRWLVLSEWQKLGRISGLRRQIPFVLHAAGGKAVTRYRADFVYVENGERVVEDVKGKITATYRLKRAWLLAEYGIRIRET